MEVLDFWLKNGENYQGVLRAALHSRRGLPPRFAEIEEMTEPWMPFYIASFYELMTERPVGMALGHIPWSKIRLFADHHGLLGLSGQEFHDIIRAMDIWYLSKNGPGKNGKGSKGFQSKDEGAGEAS